MRPADLAAAMKMDASTLTRNLKPLIAAGWLRLEPGPDGRSRSVVLTPEGQAKREEAKQHWKAAQLRLNATLGEERVVALHTLIQESMDLARPRPKPSSQVNRRHPTEQAPRPHDPNHPASPSPAPP